VVAVVVLVLDKTVVGAIVEVFVRLELSRAVVVVVVVDIRPESFRRVVRSESSVLSAVAMKLEARSGLVHD
jgi:hypothetical protein